MHDLAVISKIQSITPIEGKDRIVLAKVENYDTIIQKDDFSVGDMCVYVFYDSILPDKPEFEFLRKRCWSEKWQGHRIRPMKMGGVVSEGLVLPMSLLPERKKGYKLGDVVTDELGIRLYDPEAQLEAKSKKSNWFLDIMMKYGWFRKLYNKYFRKQMSKGSYPAWVDKSDEENIEKVWGKISQSPDTEYILTEKMEGQAASYIIDKKGKFKVFSHNCGVISGNWVEVAKILDIEKKMRTFCKSHKFDSLCLQGEVCGPGIQGNIYGFNGLKLFLYGGFHSDHTRLTYTELMEFSTKSGIPTVPYLGKKKISDFDGLDDIVKFSDGNSVFDNKGKAVPREGVVWRTEDGTIHFKNKSRQYKAWFDKKEA